MANVNVIRELIKAGVSDASIEEYLKTGQNPKVDETNIKPEVTIGPGVRAAQKAKRVCTDKQREALARGRATAAANRAAKKLQASSGQEKTGN